MNPSPARIRGGAEAVKFGEKAGVLGLQPKALRRLFLHLRYFRSMGLLKARHGFRMGLLKVRVLRAKLRYHALCFLKTLSESSLSVPTISFLLLASSHMFSTIVLTVGLGQIEERLQVLDARFSEMMADGQTESETGKGNLQGVGDIHPSIKPISAADSRADSKSKP